MVGDVPLREQAMKVYVAGGSSERLTVVQPLIDRLIAAGVEVTFDWTRCGEWDRPGDEVAWFAAASADERGVHVADVVWLVMPGQKSEGSACEWGMALALKKVCIVSGATGSRNIFTTLASRAFHDHEEALEWLLSMQQREQRKSMQSATVKA